jgi:hypothetical protein
MPRNGGWGGGIFNRKVWKWYKCPESLHKIQDMFIIESLISFCCWWGNDINVLNNRFWSELNFVFKKLVVEQFFLQ